MLRWRNSARSTASLPQTVAEERNNNSIIVLVAESPASPPLPPSHFRRTRNDTKKGRLGNTSFDMTTRLDMATCHEELWLRPWHGGAPALYCCDGGIQPAPPPRTVAEERNNNSIIVLAAEFRASPPSPPPVPPWASRGTQGCPGVPRVPRGAHEASPKARGGPMTGALIDALKR